MANKIQSLIQGIALATGFVLASCFLSSDEKKASPDPFQEYFRPYHEQEIPVELKRPSNCQNCPPMAKIPTHRLTAIWGSFFDPDNPDPFYLVELSSYYIDVSPLLKVDAQELFGSDTGFFNYKLKNYNTDSTQDYYLGSWDEFILLANNKSKLHGLDTVYKYDSAKILINDLSAPYVKIYNLVTIDGANGFQMPRLFEYQSACRCAKSLKFPWGNNSASNIYKNNWGIVFEMGTDEWLNDASGVLTYANSAGNSTYTRSMKIVKDPALTPSFPEKYNLYQSGFRRFIRENCLYENTRLTSSASYYGAYELMSARFMIRNQD